MFFRIKQSPSGQVLQLLESYRNPHVAFRAVHGIFYHRLPVEMGA